MNLRISGMLLLLVGAMSGVAIAGVHIEHSVADYSVYARALASFQFFCQKNVRVETLGTTELVCSVENSAATADSFVSVSMLANVDGTRLTIKLRNVSSVTGFDPTPESDAPFAGGAGWANLGFSVTDEPMQVTVAIVDIGTDPNPPSFKQRMSAFWSIGTQLGSVNSHAGQTTQTGVLSGTLQPGLPGSVFIEFEDVAADRGHRDAFARLELTIEFEPLTCSEKNSSVTAADDLIGWINPAGGSYSVASNWDPPRVPTHDCSAGDTAVFELVQEPDIFIDAANATAGFWRVLNGHYRVHGPAQLYSDSLTDVSLEVSHNGWLQLTEGTLATVHSRIGEALGATAGRVSVLDPETLWENNGRLSISNGLMTVAVGGEVYAENLAIGTVSGQAATVEASGVFNEVRSFIEVGDELTIGHGGTGSLNVRGGAKVLTEKCDIGLHSEGTVVVGGSANPKDPLDSVSYAQLQADGTLHIGGVGVGSLSIEQGGAGTGNPVIVSPVGSGRSRLIVDGQGGIAVVNALTRLAVHGSNQIEVEAIDGGRIITEAIWIGGGTVAGTADVTIRGSASQEAPEYQSFISTNNFPETVGGVGNVLVGKDGPGQLTTSLVERRPTSAPDWS